MVEGIVKGFVVIVIEVNDCVEVNVFNLIGLFGLLCMFKDL